jgi:hypothetical protein
MFGDTTAFVNLLTEEGHLIGSHLKMEGIFIGRLIKGPPY